MNVVRAPIVWLAAALLVGGCDEEKAPLPSPPASASTVASVAIEDDASPEDFKLYLKPGVSDEEVSRHLTAGSTAIGIAIEPQQGDIKCRAVAFLDDDDRLRKRQLSLRFREQRDASCNKRAERLAISFNRTVFAKHPPPELRDEMSLADELSGRRTKARYKLRHVMAPGGMTNMWVVGGTIRRLSAAPSTIGDLLKLFPQMSDLAPHRAAKLEPVGGKQMFEKNRKIARLVVGHTQAHVELATIFAADGDGPGAPLARELSIELPRCCEQKAQRLAEHVRLALRGKLMQLRRREDLVYD